MRTRCGRRCEAKQSSIAQAEKFISDAKNGGSEELSAFELDVGDVRVFEAKTPQEPNLSKVKLKRGAEPCFAGFLAARGFCKLKPLPWQKLAAKENGKGIFAV